MSRITLYDQPDFKGKYKVFVGDVPDLSVALLSNTARSAKVEGQHWVTYKEVNFKGDFLVLAPGDHKSLGKLDRQISSLRLVTEDLMNPEIVLFEDKNYEGKSRNVQTKMDDLKPAGFNKMVSSHKVTQGVWILHQGLGQTGACLITFQGDEWPEYTSRGWDDKLSSLHPLA